MLFDYGYLRIKISENRVFKLSINQQKLISFTEFNSFYSVPQIFKKLYIYTELNKRGGSIKYKKFPAKGESMKPFKWQRWKREKAKMNINRHLTVIQKEFRKHLGTFIVGAFSFVAALLWRDAIAEALKVFEFKGGLIFYKFLSAIIVSIIAIFAIIVLTRGLKIESQVS